MPLRWADFGVDLHLDVVAAGSRRAALERALRDAIRSGRLAPRTRLPATRALAAELGLARGTVSAAYDQLATEGYLLARVGSGTVVADLSGTRRPGPAPARTARAPRYDLRPGSPDVTTFPVAAWLRASRRALGTTAAKAYDYGDPQGRVELRAALADYLGRARGVLATPDHIVIVNGYVQGLALLAKVLGGALAMEDPGLPFHRDVVRRAGARVVPLPVDDGGARTDLLPKAAVTAAVLTPAHQYPMGATLRPDRRHAAVGWARAHGGLIIEDDYDGEFRYDRQPVGALQGMAPDQVVYIGTASKTLGPALRLGWMVLPERLLEPVLETKRYTDLHTEAIGQLALADLVTSHAYDRHLRSCRLRYRRRRDLLVSRLGQGTLRRFPVDGVAAGLQALIRLPSEGPSEAAVLERAAANGLALDDLDSHWHMPGAHPPGLVVGYGTPAEGSYPAAVDTLARILRTAEQLPLATHSATAAERP